MKAPEVIAGEATSTKEADVYALGMTLLEAVTGMVPFSEKTDIAVSYAVAVKQQMPERPKEFPSFTSDEANWLWEIMVESYAYSSSARPGSSAIHNRLQNLRQYTKELPLESATNNIGTGIDEFEVEAQPHLFAYDGDETTAGFFASGPTNSGEIIQTPPRPIEREPRAMDFDVDEHQAFTPSTESVRTLQAPLAPQLQMKSESPTPSDELEPPADSATTEVDRLSKEADKLAQQFDAYGNLDDLNNAIEVYGKVAELLAPSPETLDVSSYLNLGRMMRIKFEAFYNIEDLDSAVDDALLKAYESLAYSPTHESYCDVLHELAAASLDRYLYDGSERAGDDAQRYCKRALNAPHALSGPKRAAIHITFSRLHLTRFEYFSTAEDPIRAMYSLDHASEADPTLTDDARYMENRARWLYTCYQTGQPEFASFLGEALELAHAARNSTPPETIQFPIASTFLAELLLARYEKSGGQTDLTEALELLEAAIQDVPYICPEQPWVGERLAWALVAKFTDERDREDLDDAIWFLETAVNLTVTNPYRRQARLDRLGGALTLRFRHLALGEELDVNRVAETRDLMAGIGSM
ncbi:hypothetical protein FRC12_018556 [Ceratobasidium sp. 428]|nr:hypothetical protein FRC12_018556 [Ceratobasidium sp. 428]